VSGIFLWDASTHGVVVNDGHVPAPTVHADVHAHYYYYYYYDVTRIACQYQWIPRKCIYKGSCSDQHLAH